MKFALVDGKKTEATKGAKGFCPICGSELSAYCGEVYINHWKHKGNRNCDPWWENETEWHRSWKEKFPVDWQEVTHKDENGEIHRADVKTESECVLEFQHSYLKPEERRSRNAFYRKLVWIVDGTRRKRDKTQFLEILKDSTTVIDALKRVHFPEECKLLEEWGDSNTLVFFDFQDAEDIEQSDFWLLWPKRIFGDTCLSLFSRDKFTEFHNSNKFDESIQKVISLIKEDLSRKEVFDQINMHRRTSNPKGFNRQVPRHKNKRF